MYKLIILLLITNIVFAKKKQMLDLADLYKKGKLQVVKREVKSVTENGKNFIQLSENKEEGLVWIPIKDFKMGK